MYLFPPSTDCCDWIFSDVFEWAIISLECVAMASTTKHYLNKRKKENWFFTWNEPYIWKAGQHFLVQLFFFRWWCLSFRHDGHNGLWCGFRSWLGDLSSAGVICKMPNAECRMLCLLEASVTYICFRLAFSCWQGHLQYNAVINKQKLTASKHKWTNKPKANSAFGVSRSAKYPCHSIITCLLCEVVVMWWGFMVIIKILVFRSFQLKGKRRQTAVTNRTNKFRMVYSTWRLVCSNIHLRI